MLASNFPYQTLKRVKSGPTQSSLSSPDDFFGSSVRVHLDEIEHKKVDTYLSYATVDSLDHESEWSYIACKKCTRKVRPINEDDFIDGTIDEMLASAWKCDSCGPSPSVYLRYKVQVRVVDDTGSASFTLFERDVCRLINKTAYDLKKAHEVDDDDDDSLPDELNQIVGKKLLFKVSVTDYNISKNRHVYTVAKLTDDVDIINAFKKLHGIDEQMPSCDNLSFGNDASSHGNLSTKESFSVTGDNGSTMDLTTSTAESPCGKRRFKDLGKDPVSVDSSVSKPKRRLLQDEVESP